MKTLTSIWFALCLVACSTTPPPVVVDAPTGQYLITEYSAPGTVLHTWKVTTYHETDFPRTVTFVFGGKSITLDGSYQIDQFTN